MYKHLTGEQRVIIEDRLNHKKSVRSIAKELGVSPSTVLREIKRHTDNQGATGNDCALRRDCRNRHLCGRFDCNRLCHNCNIKCKKYCHDYIQMYCDRRAENPLGLCNGCTKVKFCNIEKSFYRGAIADKQYRDTLSESRAGFDLTAKEFQIVNELASPLIKNGLSPYHVKQTYRDKLPVSEATLRRMIDSNEIDARNIDLRDKVKRKPRKTTNNAYRSQYLKISKIGHFYTDYLKYIEEHDVCVTEMDCVEGVPEEHAALLTLTSKSLSLQLAFIMDAQNSEYVVKTLDMIEQALSPELFREMFPLILTDNGSEFSDVTAMERSIDGGKRTCIFFCEPNRSDEKGTCENHHKMIRYCIPKGTPLEPYSQADITLMMNHINSYKRKALFGKSAFEVAKELVPEDFFILLGQEEIPPHEIILNPSLFRHSKCNT